MRLFLATVLAAVIPASWALALTTNTVSFQKGDANGYSGITELMISDNGAPNDGRDGSTVQSWSVDGYQPDDPSTTTTNEFSPDQPSLTKWDNIVGSGATQIPQGATILSAQVSLKTTNGAAAASNGPWSLASLNSPFDLASTRYANFPSSDPLGFRGPWWQDGYTARPINGYARVNNITVYSANVAPLVQQWASNPSTNNGYVLQSGFTGTADAWSYDTSGDAVQADRPKLTVTYTTSPVAVNKIQRGLNGYTGVTTAWVRSGTVQNADATHPDASVDDITYDGFTGTATVSPTNANQSPAPITSFQQFVDGPALAIDGTLSSPDDFALLKFNNVFGSATGQAPADKPVAKAWLVITTGDSSGNARSADKWDVYPMQHDWTTSSLYSTGFGPAPGLTAADGDIPATALDEQVGMTTGSEVRFDVTSYLEAIRNGATDHGLAILHGQDTTDGWQMWFDGAADPTLSPRLEIVSDLSTVVAGVPGDYNNDGVVNAADYVVWRSSVGASTLPNRS
ncbi:MAG TPA: DNRLRE domain-containing protein, partial [Lacipirellulaceae bacterium]|nr:DNRLRE domain-containing protein [Lacipirellulaceae bacterium]